MNPKSMLKKLLWITCRAWFVTGLCTLVVALGFGIYTSVFLIRSVPAKGTVVNLIPEYDEENDSTNYAPVFSFAAGDGKIYTIKSGVATNPPGFEVGQNVKVLYVPSHPANAKLASFRQLWFVTVLCVGLGVFFTTAGYFLLRFERRRNSLSIPVTS
jgi:hypothetical protein